MATSPPDRSKRLGRLKRTHWRQKYDGFQTQNDDSSGLGVSQIVRRTSPGIKTRASWPRMSWCFVLIRTSLEHSRWKKGFTRFFISYILDTFSSKLNITPCFAKNSTLYLRHSRILCILGHSRWCEIYTTIKKTKNFFKKKTTRHVSQRSVFNPEHSAFLKIPQNMKYCSLIPY